MSVSVHVLQYGFPLCRFSKLQPGLWPAGHKWVALSAFKEATCAGCREMGAKVLKLGEN